MTARPLSRRTFLKATGLVVGASAIGGLDLLAAAGATDAATVPTARTTAPSTLYAGPGTDGYATVAAVAKGTRVTILGTFGSFVRVRASYHVPVSGGGTTTNTSVGYLLRTVFGTLPRTLPKLTVGQVPWIERQIVAADHPQTISNLNQPDIYAGPGVREYRLFGSALIAETDIRIVMSVAWKPLTHAATDVFGAINFQNGTWPIVQIPAHSRTLSVGRNRHGAWALNWQPNGSTNTWLGNLVSRRDGGLDLTLTIPHDGRSVTVAQAGRPARTFQLKRSLYDTTRDTGMACMISAFTQFTVTHLSVFQAPTGRPAIGLLPSLKAAAPAGVTVGLWTGEQEIGDPKLLPIIRRQFNLLAYDGTSDGLRPDLSLYDFSGPDQTVNFAHRNGMRVRFYLPSNYDPTRYAPNPTWFTPAAYPPDRLMALLHEQMQAFIKRYRGYVAEWLVAGETIINGQFSTDHFWLKNVGLSYIDQVFTWARAADPSAALLYVQTADEWAEPQASAIVNHVADLRRRGTPVDAVGLEMHVRGIDPPAKADALSTMERLGALGVNVEAEEMDVNLYDVPGTPVEQYAFQAGVYRDVLEALLACGAGTNFTQANLIDPNSWLMVDPQAEGFPAAVAPVLFDGAVKPKPAFYAVLGALQARRTT